MTTHETGEALVLASHRLAARRSQRMHSPR